MSIESIDALRSKCESLLDSAIGNYPAIVMACMARVDGVAYASARAETASTVDVHRASAICSSLLALSESFSRETLQAQCLHTTITTDHGSIVTVRIPSNTKMFALCLCCDSSANLAMTLHVAVETSKALGELIEAC